MSKGMQIGREAAISFALELVEAADRIGEPIEFWIGAISFLAGAMAAHVGVPVAVATLRALGDETEQHLGRAAQPHDTRRIQ